jgi:hypothetical protein
MDYLLTLGSHALWIALYVQASSSMNLDTPTYTTTGEVTGTGYTAGGKLLTGSNVTQVGNTAILTFSNPKWTGATFTADAAIIYDADNSNHIVAFYTFASQSPIAVDFLLATNNGVVEAA